MFATFGVSVGVCFGQMAEKVRPGNVEHTRLDELRLQGYGALYSLDYEEARRLFKEMARLFPDHPAGPQCLAATLWLQELNRSRHLQASLYSTESFSTSEDKVDPQLVEQFRQWTRTAKVLAEARLRRNPRDVEALYFLGVTEGLKAVFAAAVERRFVAALGDSSRAVDRHRQVLKLDPAFRDAELSIGMYHYIIGSLPLPIKLMASIGGMRGSKKRGLETLERVAKEGRWAQDIARLLLIDLYKRESDGRNDCTLARNSAPGTRATTFSIADRRCSGCAGCYFASDEGWFRIAARLISRKLFASSSHCFVIEEGVDKGGTVPATSYTIDTRSPSQLGQPGPRNREFSCLLRGRGAPKPA